EMMAEARANRPSPPGGQASGQTPKRAAGEWQGGAGKRGAQSGSVVWYVDAAKKLHMARVTPGLTDGQKTEVSGHDLQEGMQVVTAVAAGDAATATAASQTANPFQPQRGPGRGGFGR
ncbi:MAG: hypothetical protein ACREPM_13620, partial [Gemmatimonadaceae bacterium]